MLVDGVPAYVINYILTPLQLCVGSLG